MLCSGTEPESYIAEYTLVYEDNMDSGLNENGQIMKFTTENDLY